MLIRSEEMPSEPNDSALRVPRTPVRIFRRLAFLLLGLLVALLLAEGIFRLWLRVTEGPYTAWRVRDTITRTAAAMNQRVPMAESEVGSQAASRVSQGDLLHPYFGFDHVGYNAYLDEMQAQWNSEAWKKEYKIIITGGSVASMLSEFGANALEKALRADERFRDRPIRIVGQGRGGYKQPQQVNLVVFLLSLGIVPDAIINLDGFNEVALGMTNAENLTHPLYPSITHWAPLASTRRRDEKALELLQQNRDRAERAKGIASTALGWNLYYSSILGTVMQRRILELYQATAATTVKYLELLARVQRDPVTGGPNFDGAPAVVAARCVESWSVNSRILSDICKARGIYYLHALQPTLHDEGSKPVTEYEKQVGGAPIAYIQGVKHGYPLLRRAGEALLKSGVNFFDASMVFSSVTKDIYVDNCHFKEAGNEILAAEIGRAFLVRMGK